MCTSYESNEYDRFEAFTLFAPPAFPYKREIYKDYVAPVFRRVDDGWQTTAATFGMVPRARIPSHVRPYDTMNARAESIGEKRSFSAAWSRLQLCVIPCRSFFEPNYETGKAVRWRIGLADDRPTSIAGLWRAWENPDGSVSLSFTMLTVNADDHPLMRRFHKPGDEKRSVVIIRPDACEDWLRCRSTDEARSFLQLYPADEMLAEALPLPPRIARPASNDDDPQASLLD
ncbi:SOS response-associated peptidase family protein [Paraburkholderia sp.]|uniref:SOS response-associated peptidase n=1 Tax=Paraburkholderia sp. TaxID=1926495 RepID=UPI00238A0DCA|nr:SOS response-associated peptidase family protein [Paraburkholderia sp.]MDE1181586.1 SOS response-associated peptidase family protein [Paraburkholderia sp.]